MGWVLEDSTWVATLTHIPRWNWKFTVRGLNGRTPLQSVSAICTGRQMNRHKFSWNHCLGHRSKVLLAYFTTKR